MQDKGRTLEVGKREVVSIDSDSKKLRGLDGLACLAGKNGAGKQRKGSDGEKED
jgi:hypothetical protein